MKNPFVSVIIPIKEIGHYLRDECLPALDTQTYRNFEVITLPNHVSDDDKKLVSKYPWLHIIPTGKITRPAEKRDIGAKKAKGLILAFIDDDAYPARTWLEKAVYYFKTKKTEALCGPGLIPIKTNIWEKIFDEILTNPVGSGEYQYRYIKKNPRYVDDYPSMNFFIQKDMFKKLGGFNSHYWPGEDSKLCEDLIYKCNGKIYYNPNILVYHHRRNTLIGYLKQHANYGFHRGTFFVHGDHNSRRFSYLVPGFFVLYLFILLFLLLRTNLPQIVYLPLAAYLVLGFYVIIRSYIHTKNVILSVATFPALILTHVVYGAMFIRGFIIGLCKKKYIYA